MGGEESVTIAREQVVVAARTNYEKETSGTAALAAEVAEDWVRGKAQVEGDKKDCKKVRGEGMREFWEVCPYEDDDVHLS